MKIHPSAVVVPLAVVLLVGAAGAVLATSGNPSTAPGAALQADPTSTPAATTAPTATKAPGSDKATRPAFEDTALSDALDKLVAKGTITADQKQAVLDGVKAERQARLDELKAQRDKAKAQADQLRQFLSDGQITQDELDQLPADSPLRQLTNLMDDGKITVDELRQLGRGLFPGLGVGEGRGHGFGFFGPHMKWANPDASASPAPTTGG